MGSWEWQIPTLGTVCVGSFTNCGPLTVIRPGGWNFVPSGEPTSATGYLSGGTTGPVVRTQPPPKQLSRKYSDYLTCVGGELIDEVIGDDESAFAFTLANIAPFVARSLLKGNPLYYAAFAVLYDASLGFRARQTCTKQVYGGG